MCIFCTQDRQIALLEHDLATAKVELDMLKEELENMKEEQVVSKCLVTTACISYVTVTYTQAGARQQNLHALLRPCICFVCSLGKER